MWPAGDLQYEHEALRAQLALLEQLARQGDSAHPALRALVHAFARQWRCHAEREALIVSRLPPPIRWESSQAAEAPVAQLEATAGRVPPPSRDEVAALVEQLRHWLAEEAGRVFPALDRLPGLARDEELARELVRITARHFPEGRHSSALPPCPIVAHMPIQELMHLHPTAAAVLASFAVDAQTDRLLTLEDLRSRSGLDVDAVLLALNAVLQDSQALGTLMPEIVWLSSVGMMVIDAGRRILAMNPAMERLLGYRNQDVAGRRHCGTVLACHDLRHRAMADQPDLCPGLRAMAQFNPVGNAEYVIRTSGGRHKIVGAIYTPLQARPGGPIWALVMMRDITAQKRQEHRLRHGLMLDPATGLPNHEAFRAACRRSLLEATRHHRALAVAIAGLDDAGRHEAEGRPEDAVSLKTVAGLLQTGHRRSEMVARYGKAEFAVLMPETNVRESRLVAARLQRLVAEFPFPSSTPPHASPTISVGIAVFPQDGTTAEALMRQAAIRLREAQQQGRGYLVAPAWLGELTDPSNGHAGA